MDPVTHTMVGVGMANALFRNKFGPSSVTVLALASNLPDIDAAVHLTGDPAAVLMRRTFGHSVFLLPIWSLLLALILRSFFPGLGFIPLFGLTLLGAFVHLVFDLVNSFGVVLFWPFDMWRPEWAIVFIIDFFLTGLLIAPLVISLFRGTRSHLVPISRIAMIAVAFYLLFCGANRLLAREALDAASERLGTPVEFSYVFPEPLGPLRWRGVARNGANYRIYLIHTLSNKIEYLGQDRTAVGDPAVELVRKTQRGRRLEWFFKAPVWKVERDLATAEPSRDRPVAVSVYDLRFRPAVIGSKAFFVFRFNVFPDGRVEAI
jgi:inner membrane protein